jgi:hypothetical protein
VHEVDAVLQGLATLRPQLVTALLQYCRSIKAKRLFLALGETSRSGPLRLQVQTSGTEATGRFALRSSHDPRILLLGYRISGSQPLL